MTGTGTKQTTISEILQYLIGPLDSTTTDSHGFNSLQKFLCTHMKASLLVGLSAPSALWSEERRVTMLGFPPRAHSAQPLPSHGSLCRHGIRPLH